MRHRVVFVLLALLAGVIGAGFLACSSDPAADGAECEANGDCNSGICLGGSCAGRVCSCSGPSCAKECDDGWVCSTRGSVPGLSCVRSCGGGSACPAGNHCSGGVCVTGKEITTAWVARPGDTKCRLGTACRYEVRASGEGAGDVKAWSWTLGDAGVIENADADIEFRYPTAGIYPVNVTAALADGRKGPTLEAIERVCADDPEFECSPGGDDCCSGTCTVAKRCR